MVNIMNYRTCLSEFLELSFFMTIFGIKRWVYSSELRNYLRSTKKAAEAINMRLAVSIFPVFKVIIASTTVVRFRFKSKQEIIISRVKNKTLRAPLKTHSMSSHDFLCNYNHMGRFLISNTDPAGSIFSVGFGDNREPSPVISVERDELY